MCAGSTVAGMAGSSRTTDPVVRADGCVRVTGQQPGFLVVDAGGLEFGPGTEWLLQKVASDCSQHTDPAQADRLRDLITSLHARTAEAEQNNWLGEVEGLKTSLVGAQEKLEEMERLTADDGPVLLGLPTIISAVHEKSSQAND